MVEWFGDICTGFLTALQFGVFMAAIIGVLVGIVIGVLPGLGPPVAISLAIPLTFSFEPIIGMAVILGIYKGGTYGGSISAILINTPGTPAASATVMDGFPLAKQGKAGKALDVALYASVFGDAFSIFLLCVIAQPIAAMAAKFGPTELFSLMLLAMTIISCLAGKNLYKGLIAACIGISVSFIGIDPVEGLPRFTFDILILENGLTIIPIIVGLFALSELMNQVTDKKSLLTGKNLSLSGENKEDNYVTRKDFKRIFPIFLQSSVIGSCIGALPGTGSAAAAFIGYGMAKKRSKNPEEFGKGSIEGVAAAESANNAVCGGALIPMLTLGIPGDDVTAILMSALMLHGINSGPTVFTEHRAFIFGVFGMLLVSIFMLLILGKIACKVCRKIVKLPQVYISTVVILLCVVGVYAVASLISDSWIMLIFGIIGFVLVKLNIPLPPFIIAFILAPKVEQTFRQSMLISGGDPIVFVNHPISAVLLAITAVIIIKIGWARFHQTR